MDLINNIPKENFIVLSHTIDENPKDSYYERYIDLFNRTL